MKVLAYIVLVVLANTCFAQTQGFEGTTRKEEVFTMVEELSLIHI